MKDNMRIEKEIKYIQHTDRSEIRERVVHGMGGLLVMCCLSLPLQRTATANR